MINKEELKKISDRAHASNARLVAVSKTKPQEAIKEMYDCGQRIFGENRVQELIEKECALPSDIAWHMIGHLQTNKVKYIAPFISMIHSVDSMKLLKEINKQATKNSRTIDVLLQFHIAQESEKYGFTVEEISKEIYIYENVRICGVMGMATFTSNMDQVRSEFQALKKIYDSLKKEYFPNTEVFSEVSMGMSGDYELALEEGSTLIRIGSLLFGSR